MLNRRIARFTGNQNADNSEQTSGTYSEGDSGGFSSGGVYGFDNGELQTSTESVTRISYWTGSSVWGPIDYNAHIQPFGRQVWGSFGTSSETNESLSFASFQQEVSRLYESLSPLSVFVFFNALNRFVSILRLLLELKASRVSIQVSFEDGQFQFGTEYEVDSAPSSLRRSMGAPLRIR